MLELCSHPAHGLGPSPAPHAVHMVGVKRKATAALHDGSAARLALLPDVLRLVESQTPHITHAEVHNFFSSADVSDAYFEENDADAIASHIASVWAAKLLLDVGSSMGSGAGAGVGPTPARHHHHHHALSSTSPDSPLDSEEGGASDMDSASDGDALRMADAHDALHAGRDDTSGSAGKAKQSRRLVWTEDLHRRFEDAVAKLGSENAKPQAIQQLMNVDGITTRNIKSHLQKYRLRLQKHPSTTSALSAGVSSAARSCGVHSLSVSDAAAVAAADSLSPQLHAQPSPGARPSDLPPLPLPARPLADQTTTPPASPSAGGEASAFAHAASPARSPHPTDAHTMHMPAAIPMSESFQSRTAHELGPRHPTDRSAAAAAGGELWSPTAPS